MTMEGMDLTPLDTNLHKYDPVIISQMIQMIEMDVFLAPKDLRVSLEGPLEDLDGRNPRIGKHIHVLYRKW